MTIVKDLAGLVLFPILLVVAFAFAGTVFLYELITGVEV